MILGTGSARSQCDRTRLTVHLQRESRSTGLNLIDAVSTSFQIYLKDPQRNPLSSADLVAIHWDESVFPQREVAWTLDDGVSQLLGHERIDSLSGVPEPGVATLLAVGALALAARRLRIARV